jgi:hypothetical protein
VRTMPVHDGQPLMYKLNTSSLPAAAGRLQSTSAHITFTSGHHVPSSCAPFYCCCCPQATWMTSSTTLSTPPNPSDAMPTARRWRAAMHGPPALPWGLMAPLLAVVLAVWPGGQLTTLTRPASYKARAKVGSV